MKEVILVGGGGHCRSCIDIIEQEGSYSIAGIIDLPQRKNQKVLGYPIIGSDDDIPVIVQEFSNFIICVGQIKSAAVRKRLFEQITILGGQFPVIASPRAYVSPHAVVGRGTIIMHDALVNAGARIGKNCIINTKALVEHDVLIGDHCHVATGARVNGGVTLGDEVFIGSGAVCKEAVSVSSRSLVGGNAFVHRDL